MACICGVRRYLRDVLLVARAEEGCIRGDEERKNDRSPVPSLIKGLKSRLATSQMNRMEGFRR